MDGKGRALDNINVYRFLRTVKYEEVYLKDYYLSRGSSKLFERLLQLLWFKTHQARSNKTSPAVYFQKRRRTLSKEVEEKYTSIYD